MTKPRAWLLFNRTVLLDPLPDTDQEYLCQRIAHSSCNSELELMPLDDRQRCLQWLERTRERHPEWITEHCTGCDDAVCYYYTCVLGIHICVWEQPHT